MSSDFELGHLVLDPFDSTFSGAMTSMIVEKPHFSWELESSLMSGDVYEKSGERLILSMADPDIRFDCRLRADRLNIYLLAARTKREAERCSRQLSPTQTAIYPRLQKDVVSSSVLYKKTTTFIIRLENTLNDVVSSLENWVEKLNITSMLTQSCDCGNPHHKAGSAGFNCSYGLFSWQKWEKRCI